MATYIYIYVLPYTPFRLIWCLHCLSLKRRRNTLKFWGEKRRCEGHQEKGKSRQNRLDFGGHFYYKIGEMSLFLFRKCTYTYIYIHIYFLPRFRPTFLTNVGFKLGVMFFRKEAPTTSSGRIFFVLSFSMLLQTCCLFVPFKNVGRKQGLHRPCRWSALFDQAREKSQGQPFRVRSLSGGVLRLSGAG